MRSPKDRDQGSRRIVELVKKSAIYRDYSRAFKETTGLSLNIRAADSLHLNRVRKDQNPFCMLMAETNHSCAACLTMQKSLEEKARLKPHTMKCFAGLCETAVPVRVGENLIAFLETGQIFLHKPGRDEFTRAAKQLLAWGSKADLKRIEESYFHSRVVDPKQYQSIIRLLEIFAMHLAALSNQLVLQDQKAESPMIQKAKAFIDANQADDIRLAQVASAVNTSAFYFCKMFKQATGMTFTDYLARLRVEKVKSLLLNPHIRISEAAFQVGFQSLSQFNRVFRKVAGESPTTYRERVMNPALASA
ncbi:MAG TPA: helix-turn-helix domain-containing protein, partial [Opitutaceae bacterium]